MKKRVVVTGMRGLSPIGNTIDEMWANAKNGYIPTPEVYLESIKNYDSKSKLRISFPQNPYLLHQEYQILFKFFISKLFPKLIRSG